VCGQGWAGRVLQQWHWWMDWWGDWSYNWQGLSPNERGRACFPCDAKGGLKGGAKQPALQRYNRDRKRTAAGAATPRWCNSDMRPTGLRPGVRKQKLKRWRGNEGAKRARGRGGMGKGGAWKGIVSGLGRRTRREQCFDGARGSRRCRRAAHRKHNSAGCQFRTIAIVRGKAGSARRNENSGGKGGDRIVCMRDEMMGATNLLCMRC